VSAPAIAAPETGAAPEAATHRAVSRWPLAVAAVVLAALALRLWGIAYGLPFSYYGDENSHYVNVAIRFFEHGTLNPHYFVNPPGYTELLYLVFGVRYGFGGGAVNAFSSDPGSVFLTARVVSAVLGALSVYLLYLAGARLFDRRVALLAAGILAVAFVPVFYAHQALDDAPSLAPLCLSLLGTALVLRRGRPLDWALAGLGLGLAAGVKYLCWIVIVPLAGAAVVRLRRGPWKPVVVGAAIAGAATVVGFLVTNPYALLDHHIFLQDLRRQRATSSHQHPGQTQANPLAYYAWVMTWGFGWVPALASVAGAALLVRSRRALALVLVPTPLVMVAFVSHAAVAWARYLIPAMPVLALLAAYAGVRVAEALSRRRPRLAPAAWALVALLLCGQGLFTVVHNDRVLARQDTRNQTRDWLLSRLPPGTKVVVGPIMAKHRPENGLKWLSPRAGQPEALTVYPFTEYAAKYERSLSPKLLGRYARQGYCYVVTASTRVGLTLGLKPSPRAFAYYQALERRARIAFRASPFAVGAPVAPGREKVRFQWDLSYDYYPLAYQRPGPVMTVYRLTNGACA
jgi:hypothetical protein